MGSLNQGTLFSCGAAEDYAGCDVHGIVITARCDVANDKAQIYNYLPVVKLDDWLKRDGRILIAERGIKTTFGEMKNALKDVGYN